PRDRPRIRPPRIPSRVRRRRQSNLCRAARYGRVNSRGGHLRLRLRGPRPVTAPGDPNPYPQEGRATSGTTPVIATAPTGASRPSAEAELSIEVVTARSAGSTRPRRNGNL